MIRTIPNTPCLVQSGVIAYTPGSNCTAREVAVVDQLLKSVGMNAYLLYTRFPM